MTTGGTLPPSARSECVPAVCRSFLGTTVVGFRIVPAAPVGRPAPLTFPNGLKVSGRLSLSNDPVQHSPGSFARRGIIAFASVSLWSFGVLDAIGSREPYQLERGDVRGRPRDVRSQGIGRECLAGRDPREGRRSRVAGVALADTVTCGLLMLHGQCPRPGTRRPGRRGPSAPDTAVPPRRS